MFYVAVLAIKQENKYFELSCTYFFIHILFLNLEYTHEKVKPRFSEESKLLLQHEFYIITFRSTAGFLLFDYE